MINTSLVIICQAVMDQDFGIQTTNNHWVVHRFTELKIVRKLTWLFVFLAIATGGLYNHIDKIKLIVGRPTGTTITIARKLVLDFPAVSICNLNVLRKDYLQRMGLEVLIRDPMFRDIHRAENLQICSARLQHLNLPDITYQSLLEQGTDELLNLVVGCHFQGRICSIDTHNFVPTMTRFGVCYTFNSGKGGKPIQKAYGTGSILGLRLTVNATQDQYIATTNKDDAGLKIVVHNQADPPQPDVHGIAAPIGKSVFVSMKQLTITDRTKQSCKSREEASRLNFMQGEYDYSYSACKMDCYYSQIADACGCILVNTFNVDRKAYKHLKQCSIFQTCCVLAQQSLLRSCNCLPSCNSNTYKLNSSYSSFLAEHISVDSLKGKKNNLIAASIYYKTLGVSEEVTSFFYNIVSLISDIGDHISRFLGINCDLCQGAGVVGT